MTKKKQAHNPISMKYGEYVEYEADTGRFYWKKDVSLRSRAGSEAGCVARGGWRQIRICGETIKCGRLAWLLYYGEDIGSNVIYHTNRIQTDDRITNLQSISRAELAKRRKYKKENKVDTTINKCMKSRC